jgi:hypothetical protein
MALTDRPFPDCAFGAESRMAIDQPIDELDRRVRMHLFGASANTARIPTNPEIAPRWGCRWPRSRSR